MKHTTQDRLAMLTETKHVRPICAACRRPERVCLCNSGGLPPNGPINIGNLCEILILQHPAEAKKKANTVPLMELVIQNVRIVQNLYIMYKLHKIVQIVQIVQNMYIMYKLYNWYNFYNLYNSYK